MAKNTLLSFLFLLCSAFGAAAQEAAPQMADQMRADGKIWVVVMVLATIFAGIIIYLIRLDRKVGRIEKETSR